MKLPSVSQNQRWKHFRSNPEQSSKNRKKKEKEQRNDPQGSCSPSALSPSALSFMLRRCTLCGPPVFVPDIPAQSVLQCASWSLQDSEGIALATAVWPGGGRDRLLALSCRCIRELPSLKSTGKCKQHVCALSWIYTVYVGLHDFCSHGQLANKNTSNC